MLVQSPVSGCEHHAHIIQMSSDHIGIPLFIMVRSFLNVSTGDVTISDFHIQVVDLDWGVILNPTVAAECRCLSTHAHIRQ